ncbi:MAG: hypothetical protein RIQ62_1003 [Bacteroidota bacterium]
MVPNDSAFYMVVLLLTLLLNVHEIWRLETKLRFFGRMASAQGR